MLNKAKEWTIDKWNRFKGWVAVAVVGTAIAATALIPVGGPPSPGLVPFDPADDILNGEYTVLVDITNGEVLNQFQSNPHQGTLIGNAVRAGLATENELLEVTVSKESYDKYKDAWAEVSRPQREAEIAAHQAELIRFEQKLMDAGFTDQDLLDLEDLMILKGARFSKNPRQ